MSPQLRKDSVPIRGEVAAVVLRATFHWSPTLKALYRRLVERGKPHTSALVAFARKLLVFASSGAVRGPKKAPLLKVVATAFPRFVRQCGRKRNRAWKPREWEAAPDWAPTERIISVASERPSISLDSGPAVGRQLSQCGP